MYGGIASSRLEGSVSAIEAERLARGPVHPGGALTLRGVDTIEDRERGRELYTAHAWKRAYESLSSADLKRPLEALDLELLADRGLHGRPRRTNTCGALERAHHAYAERRRARRAARCAFWVGIDLLAPAVERRARDGWFGRAQRLLEREGGDCAERGYLLIPALLRARVGGRLIGTPHDAAAAEAAAIGERFGDRGPGRAHRVRSRGTR